MNDRPNFVRGMERMENPFARPITSRPAKEMKQETNPETVDSNPMEMMDKHKTEKTKAMNPELAVVANELTRFIKSKASNFACGGAISVSAPFTLRWDTPVSNPSVVTKLDFPIDTANEREKEALYSLVQECEPASFGYKGEDVIDETYRKATKLDRSAFSIDLCPYELGIVDTIAQVLLPGAAHGVGTKGVRAELYKLNIYQAPAGFFKPHVDTPRSSEQFGSLVISLPCYHKGGQLAVRHAGHSHTFDWGVSESNDKTESHIQWAAFYSDCEHEVLDVTDGHRITLTYNLYFAPGLGDLANNSPAMDITSLPLYHKVNEALKDPSFMRNGGNLGLHCQYAYAYSTEEGYRGLPSALKGIDMAMYSVFRALGLNIDVFSVLLDTGSSGCETVSDNSAAENSDNDNVGPNLEPVSKTWVNQKRGIIWNGEVEDYYGGMDEVYDNFGPNPRQVAWILDRVETNRNIGLIWIINGNQAETDFKYTSVALIVEVPPAVERIAALDVSDTGNES